MKIFKKILYIFFIFLNTLYAKDYIQIKDLNGNKVYVYKNELTEEQKIILLKFFNTIRRNMKLPLLSYNKKLEIIALLHANYIYQTGNISHTEDKNDIPYFGKNPSDRGKFIKYNNNFIGEVFAINSKNVKTSIFGLLSAPYHRLSILSPEYNSIGIATIKDKSNNRYITVIEFSNKYLENYCGKFKYPNNKGLCNSNIKPNIRYIFSYLQNYPSIFIYPYKNEKKINTVFFTEIPNPLLNFPGIKMTGYPITVTINPFHYKNIKNINCYLNGNKMLKLSYLNDKNKKLKKYEFVFFPLHRLNFNSKYNVECIDNKGNKYYTYFKTLHYKDYINVDNYKFLRLKIKNPFILYSKNNVFNGYSYKSTISKNYLMLYPVITEGFYVIYSYIPGNVWLSLKGINGNKKIFISFVN